MSFMPPWSSAEGASYLSGEARVGIPSAAPSFVVLNDRGLPGNGRAVLRAYCGRLYPACTKHGAMAGVGGGVWRCLGPRCNVGMREVDEDG